MSTLSTGMEEKAGKKLLLFIKRNGLEMPCHLQCSYEVFTQWHRALLEGKSLSVTEGGPDTSGPDPEEETLSPSWHQSPENPW